MSSEGEIQQHSFNVSLLKSFNANSFNEFFSCSLPYELTIEIEELVSPPKNSRKAAKFRKDPSSSPPRPQNAFLLFRRDFYARLKLNKIKISNGDVSRLASEEWKKLPNEVLRFFGVLEKLAKDRHKQVYPGYKYSPKKCCGKKSESRGNGRQKNNELASEPFLTKIVNVNHFSDAISFLIENSNNTLIEQEIIDFSEYIYYDPEI
ncbi:MATA-HMG [Gigaspora margarita]|uniref:MATA-HMG n=1 Tax=Gigaspora margarita TaxID=4874 RepID=A0A8H4A4U8_GIGMA|nr:MATA-HMG [Gigaspora margarita]